MRQHAAGLNRAWLTVIGIVVTLSGVVAASIALCLIGPAVTATRAPVTALPVSDPVVDPGVGGFLDQQPVVVAVGVAGLVLGLLAVAWLLAQVPRTNAAKPYRLHDDATRGLTVCAPNVLTEAGESDVAALT